MNGTEKIKNTCNYDRNKKICYMFLLYQNINFMITNVHYNR